MNTDVQISLNYKSQQKSNCEFLGKKIWSVD